MNTGKIFERQWKKSVEECKELFYYRFKDSPSSWGTGQGIRFTNDNICDIMMFDTPILFLLELKVESGKSIAHNRLRNNQLEGLLNASCYKNICAGVIVYFSSIDECYFINIKNFEEHQKTSGRKSIPLSWCKEFAIKINVKPLKVNRMYDVKQFVKEMKEIKKNEF